MTKIEILKLPERLPTEKAIRSFKQNRHNYEPEFWESEYEFNRYLQNINDNDLIQRYSSVKENFVVYTESRRDVIPIISFLSSWYWYRKEHQTRYEFFLRGIEIPIGPPMPVLKPSKLFCTRKPNSCEKLFRYGNSEFMNEFVSEGKIRISDAFSYKDGAIYDPRTDDELNKYRWAPGKSIKMQTQTGRNIPIIGDMKSTASAPNYYTLCLSTEFEKHMFDKFGYDSCIVIHEPEVFEARIKKATYDLLRDWYFIGTPIQYFDPFEKSSRNEIFLATISKDFSYAYQKEYRILWDPLKKEGPKDVMYFCVGDLSDICELYLNK